MGLSIHIVGFKPADEKWEKMKAVWESCEAAGIPIPPDVEKFFRWEKPDESGVTVDRSALGSAVEEFSNMEASGFQVDLTRLHKDVKILRFYISN